MKICLVDDEINQLEYLQYLIKKASDDCDITIYYNAEEMLFENNNTFPFDLIILDIQMKQINGIELAKKIREYDQKVMIVFLTGISDYVFTGYEVQAFRYLLKPIKEEEMMALLEVVKAKIETTKKYLIVSILGEKDKIPFDDIIYLESFGHYLKIYTIHKQYELKKSMSEIAKELDDGFIFTHRSYLVNIQYIQKIAKEFCVLINNIQIPVSRNHYNDVNNRFIAYYKDEELL